MSRNRIKIWNFLEKLEEQMVFWDPNSKGADSPDRLDAMVWGITALLIDPPYDLRARVSRIMSSAGRKLSTPRGTGKARGFVPKTKRT